MKHRFELGDVGRIVDVDIPQKDRYSLLVIDGISPAKIFVRCYKLDYSGIDLISVDHDKVSLCKNIGKPLY